MYKRQSCHTLRYLRWNRLQRDLDIPETVLIDDLISNENIKTSDFVTFGLPEISPIGAPDLTLRTRVRGDDWIYTYLQTFYQDAFQATGSNNLVYPGTAMAHVLVGLQGTQELDSNGKLIRLSKGALEPEEFDSAMKDLVNFLAYASEPALSLIHI